MANTKISMLYDLHQSNLETSPSYGKWYPRAVRRDTLSLRGLADHIADHGSIYTRDVVLGVLTKFTSCLTELVSQGTGVKLDGLGTFYPTLEAKGAESPVGYDVNAHVKGVHIRFLPESADLDNITSREFAKKCILQQNMIFDMAGKPKRIVNGELVDYGNDENP